VYDRDTINRKKLGTELGMLRYRVPGLTQEKMARLVGVSPVTIRNWENGGLHPFHRTAIEVNFAEML